MLVAIAKTLMKQCDICRGNGEYYSGWKFDHTPAFSKCWKCGDLPGLVHAIENPTPSSVSSG